jgi:PAS domain S-box-containing protein
MDPDKKREELYRLITENAGDVIWIMDVKKGKFTYVSPSVRKLRGFTPEEVLNQSVSEVLTPESYQFILDNLGMRIEQFSQGNDSMRVMVHEMDQICKDGSIIHTEVVTTLMTDEEGRVNEILGVSRDITERKLAQQEIARLNEELEQRIAERTSQLTTSNNELEAFTYSVSHDLRAPLRAINGFSTILSKEHSGSLDDEAKRLLNIIRDNVKRMDRLITDLLAFSRLSRSEINLLSPSMNAIVRAAFDSNSTDEDKKNIRFILHDLPNVPCDPSLMGQVWGNLISNSIKFTTPMIDRIIEISGKKEKFRVVYEIKDNGVGFNPKYKDKLFEVFQRLHKMDEFEGSGVGLAIVKRIINRHGGVVSAEGKEGAGSRFTISLPNTPIPR